MDFADLYTRYAQDVFRFAYFLSGNRELAEDIAAETLSLTRRRLRGYLWLLQLAMVFTMLSFGRIVADTSWDVSPRNFIITASMAIAFWIAFFVTLIRMRARILVVPSR